MFPFSHGFSYGFPHIPNTPPKIIHGLVGIFHHSILARLAILDEPSVFGGQPPWFCHPDVRMGRGFVTYELG